ncbi:MAG: hypothetical protein ACYS8Y_09165 [Planctomycetota bacterium]|jgi:hypothetical protein
MLNGLKTFLKDHSKAIIATVIGGLILTIVLTLGRKITLFLRDNKALKVIAVILGKEVHLSVYWLLLLFIAGFVLAFILFKLAVLFNKKLEYYTKDVVSGLIWEWDTYNFATSLMALCPKCEAELKFRESHNHATYACFRCNFNKRLEFNRQNIEEVVRIEIEKRERTGKWKKAEKRIKEIKNKR